jgi:FG-GAP-like repeat
MWRAVALVLMTGTAQAEVTLSAKVRDAILTDPTDRYDHGVLGDKLEWGALTLSFRALPEVGSLTITLPDSRVFEDVEARVVDVTGDGWPEVVVVETDVNLGASLAVYGQLGKIAATPFIGQRHRWLAPAGVGDFDGDGQIEIAYVDRPHLLKELVFVRLKGNQLVEVGLIPNLTNHQIGDDFVTGGVRNCGQGDELVLASGDWSQAMVVTMTGARAAGAVDRIPALMDCRD